MKRNTTSASGAITPIDAYVGSTPIRKEQIFQVGADAEGPVAGTLYDRDAQRRISGIAIERIGKFTMGVRMHRVEDFGPIDRQGQ
ncbi:hypothetical protein P0D88_32790 [Paraburkholderia sp. RL18-103-BIB-C]|jgi:hypothetical protein